MSPLNHPVACERVRAQVSLELDAELSQLERAMLAAHVLRCADCRAYRRDVHAVTCELRTAPLESAPPLTVRRYRRSAVATRFQAGFAAAMALAVVGVAAQAVDRPDGSSRSSSRISQFGTQNQLEREQQLIQGVPESGTHSSGEATLR